MGAMHNWHQRKEETASKSSILRGETSCGEGELNLQVKKRITSKMKINTLRRSGFTLLEIMIVVAFIGMLAAIAIPTFIRARSTSQTNACINNLRQIDSAVQQWTLEKNKSGTDQVTSTDATPYLGHAANGIWPKCPGGGAYSVTDVSTKPTCTLSSLGHTLQTQ